MENEMNTVFATFRQVILYPKLYSEFYAQPRFESIVDHKDSTIVKE